MLDFFNMADNYEDRKVARFDGSDFIIDTCAVTDSDQPYETGVQHPKYNDGEWVIVEMYEDVDAARVGHDKWVVTMTNDPLPNQLIDVSTSEIAILCKAISGV